MLLMVVKPVLIRILEGAPNLEPSLAGGASDLDGAMDQNAEGDANSTVANSGASAISNDNADSGGKTSAEMESMLNLQQVEGQVRESSVKQISALLEDKPADSINVIRDWMNEERSGN